MEDRNRLIQARSLRIWRKRMRFTLREASEALGIHPGTLAGYESGRRRIPRSILLAAHALRMDLEPLGTIQRNARDTWVQLVEDMRDYARGKPVVGEMLKNREIDRLRHFLRMVKTGPDLDIALTDPALFRMLSEAVLRARLAGLAEYRVFESAQPRRSGA